jgi:hypothetical protein
VRVPVPVPFSREPGPHTHHPPSPTPPPPPPRAPPGPFKHRFATLQVPLVPRRSQGGEGNQPIAATQDQPLLDPGGCVCRVQHTAGRVQQVCGVCHRLRPVFLWGKLWAWCVCAPRNVHRAPWIGAQCPPARYPRVGVLVCPATPCACLCVCARPQICNFFEDRDRGQVSLHGCVVARLCNLPGFTGLPGSRFCVRGLECTVRVLCVRHLGPVGAPVPSARACLWQYHCDKCGMCRVGGASNFFHCDKCGGCFRTSVSGARALAPPSPRGLHHVPARSSPRARV